jgi:multiple sugar transport system permease protein
LRSRTLFARSVPFLLMLPLLVWLLCFAIAPMLYGFWLSLHHAFIENLSSPRWAGLANYRFLFGDPAFVRGVKWSLRFAVTSVSLEMIVGVTIAQFFNREIPGKGIAIALLMLPMVISAALMGTMFRLLFNEFVGPVHYLLSFATGGAALLGANYVGWTLLAADAVNATPFVFINTYAALQAVPTELLEAAEVDGASGWQRFWKITFPLVLPIVGITFLERLLAAFLIFALVYTLTGGGPGNMTQSVSIYIYRRAFGRSDFGMANAAAFSMAAILLAPAMVIVRRMMRSFR